MSSLDAWKIYLLKTRYHVFWGLRNVCVLTPQQHVLLTSSHCGFRSYAMAPTPVHLPNGQMLTVSRVFAGLSFKSNDLNVHHSVSPPAAPDWTIISESEDEPDPGTGSEDEEPFMPRKRSHIRRYRSPVLHNDVIVWRAMGRKHPNGC